MKLMWIECSINMEWKEHSITATIKIRLIRNLIFSIFLLDVETWTPQKAEKESVEIGCLNKKRTLK